MPRRTTGESVPKWSAWLRFPDPRKLGVLAAPYGAGVYELRNRETGQYVLRGMGANCAYRMSSLLPKPWGQGTRKNERKRKYVFANLAYVEYRYHACRSEKEAKALEAVRKLAEPCLFNA